MSGTVRTERGEITVAAACNEHGRAFFASLDARHYRPIPHFPRQLEEAVALYGGSRGPTLSLDELSDRFKGEVVAMPLARRRPAPRDRPLDA
jgi:hypothetical protein